MAFDISSRYKLEEQMGDAPFFDVRDELAYLWKNRLDRASHTLDMELTFFVREADGRYRRFDERHRQRAHSAAELEQWLTEAGFVDIRRFWRANLCTPDPRGRAHSLSCNQTVRFWVMDELLRISLLEGQARAMLVKSAALVEEARKIHDLSRTATAALGRLLTGTAMLGAMLKSPTDSVTVSIRGNGPMGRLLSVGAPMEP